jgi:hypothetical protein
VISLDDQVPPRAQRLGWLANSQRELAEQAEYHLNSINKLINNRPPGVAWWRVSAEAISNCYFRFMYLYLLSRDEEAKETVREWVRYAEEYFFGEWRHTAPPNNNPARPPDPEWWHQGTTDFPEYVRAVFAASLLDRWDFVDRVSEYWSTIRWWEPEVARFFLRVSGREEVAWTLALASVIRGKPFDDPYLKPLIEMIENGRLKREKWLWGFLAAIVEGSDAELQAAADDYFAFYLKREAGRKDLSKKVSFHGTILVNLARHRGRTIGVSDAIGERYVRLPA